MLSGLGPGAVRPGGSAAVIGPPAGLLRRWTNGARGASGSSPSLGGSWSGGVAAARLFLRRKGRDTVGAQPDRHPTSRRRALPGGWAPEKVHLWD